MLHARTQIRTAAIAALQNLPSIGVRVYPGRMTPVDPKKLGGICLLVYCADEPRIEAASMGTPYHQDREIELKVRVVVKAADGIEDAVDVSLLEVEIALAAADTLGGLIPAGLQLASIQTGLDESLESPAAVAEMTYRGEYQVINSDPSAVV